MRIWMVVVVTVVLGTTAGLGLTWRTYGRVENEFGLRPAEKVVPKEPPPGSPKVVVVGGEKFDFGTLDHNQAGRHSFVIQNDGQGVLSLAFHLVSCGKCLKTQFTEARLEPGQTCEVEVEYATKKFVSKFSERLELTTNDTSKPQLDLRIEGYVTHAVRPSVEELTVGAISANEDNTTSFRLYAYRSDELQVLDQEFVQPGTADLFQLDVRHLDKGEFADEPKAKVALEVNLTIKPGLPLGPISQTIRLKVKTDEETTIEVPIVGRVSSDITIVGGGFNAENSSVYLGNVSAKEGQIKNLRVLVKGPYRDAVTLGVKSIDPSENLQVRLGDVIKVGDGAVLMYPLDLEVLKDSPITNRLGTKQAKAAKIVLSTTHPIAKEVLVFVRFALVE